jgi:hypothetical protein
MKAMTKTERDAAIDALTSKLQQPSERRPIEMRQLQIQQVEEERAAELAETKAKAAEILKYLDEHRGTKTKESIEYEAE